jgi:hypothetical protein
MECKYITFAVGVLATCKLMRDEVQLFFAKAFKTGDLETTQSVGLVDDNIGCATRCLYTTMRLMQVFGDLFDNKYAVNGFKNQIEQVNSATISPHDDIEGSFQDLQILSFWVPESREAVKAGFFPFLSHAARVYKKFGRRLRINVHWSGSGTVSALLFDQIMRERGQMQHLMEVKFISEPELKSEPVEASS